MRTCGSTHTRHPPSLRMHPSASFPRPLPTRPHPENLNRGGVYHSFTSRSERERGKTARRLAKERFINFPPKADPWACNRPLCTRKAISPMLLHATSMGTPHHGQVRWHPGHLAEMSTVCGGIQTDGSCLEADPQVPPIRCHSSPFGGCPNGPILLLGSPSHYSIEQASRAVSRDDGNAAKGNPTMAHLGKAQNRVITSVHPQPSPLAQRYPLWAGLMLQDLLKPSAKETDSHRVRSTGALVEVQGNSSPLEKFSLSCSLLSPWGVSSTFCTEIRSPRQRQEQIRNKKQEAHTRSWKGRGGWKLTKKNRTLFEKEKKKTKTTLFESNVQILPFLSSVIF